MDKKNTVVAIIALFISLSAASLLFLGPGENPKEENLQDYRAVVSSTPGQITKKEIPRDRKFHVRDLKPAGTDILEKGTEQIETKGAYPEKEAAVKPTIEQPRYIEEIKEQIYERDIESVDRIHLLDELVQTGDKDTRQFWGDGWTSVDDWKKDSNGFRLEKKEDGSLIFSPDEATAGKYTFFENPLPYTYDDVNREFVNEIDYYGKTIYNVAKFINDDVLVTMTISGTKVDLNIYQKNANPQ